MSTAHLKIYRLTDGTRIAASSQARAEEMHAAGMRDVADVLIYGKRPSLTDVVDERAESCAFYVDGNVDAT